MIGDHKLTTRSTIPLPRAEVFAFFAEAANLQRITPPELGFEILTRQPIAMERGTLLDYRLGLFGIPFHWVTRISHWEPDIAFVDEQLKGPYAQWIHTHHFEDVAGGTLVTDEVRYRLPFFPVGEVAYPLVRLQLRRIFRYRARRLIQLLGPAGSA